MKVLMLLLSFFLPVCLSAEITIDDLTVDREKILTYRVVSQSENCTIIEIETKDNVFLLNVVAGILTSAIPDVVEAICTNAGGSPKFCKVGYAVSEALVSVGSGKIAKGITNGLKWIAKKAGFRTVSKVSKVAVEVKSYEAANAMKSVFEAYSDAGCMPWQSTKVSKDNYEFADWNKAETFNRETYSKNSSSLYTVNWQIGYSKYSGLLKLNSFGNGTFRVFFYDPSCNCNRLVEQAMSLHSASQGIIIVGRNPVDVHSGLRANYSPDNFIVTVNAYGGVTVMIRDRAGVSAYGSMAAVNNTYQKKQLLNTFGM